MTFKLALLALTLSSTSAIACPTITGKFKCYGEDKTTPALKGEITQSTTGDVTTYTVAHADTGRTETILASKKGERTSSGRTISCTKDALVFTESTGEIMSWKKTADGFKMLGQISADAELVLELGACYTQK
jgi:hypothetical protein